MRENNYSRRSFLKTLSATSIAALAAGPSKGLAQMAGDDGTYDYVVIGSGAGGAPVACRLAKAGYRVLVVEAGGRDVNQNSTVPALHLKSTEDPKYSWDYF